MRANLHLHSRYSDGSLWPREIAERAAALGLECLSVTDHDTLGGTEELVEAAGRLGMRAIPGCEIDCHAPEIGYKSEILAYFPQGGASRTREFLDGVTRRRAERLRGFISAASTLFRKPGFTFEDLLAWKLGPRAATEADSGPADRLSSSSREAGEDQSSPSAPGGRGLSGLSFNKVDFFLYLKARGSLDPRATYKEFKQAYFETGLIPDTRYRRTLLDEAAVPVLADGGLLVLPHVGHQFDDDPRIVLSERKRLRRLLEFFKDKGVSGVEMYYYREGGTREINALVRELAEPLGFFFTYGSDCHGPGSEKHTLGEFEGDFPGFPAAVPASALAASGRAEAG